MERPRTNVSTAPQPLPKLILNRLSFASAPPKEQDGIKKDLPTLTISELIQLICDAWEHGLNENRAFLVLMCRIKQLLDENERYAHEKHGRFDSHWQEGTEHPQIRRQVDSKDFELDDSSTTWPESSDASSMTYSEYTVRSVTSSNERTNWLFSRNELRKR